MRTVFPSVLAALLFASAAHADVSVPGFKITGGSRAVHFGPEAERYRVFAVCHNQCAPLGLLANHTARFPQLGPRGMGESLCAVPADAAVPDRPTVEWLKSVPGAIWSEQFRESLRRDHVFFDPREGYVLHYRAVLTDEKLEMELIEDRAEWSWPTLAVFGLFLAAVALLGGWLVRRRVRRTAPPPGN